MATIRLGDHPLNDNMNYYDEIPDNYQRKVFFIIINASEKASKQELYHRREFSTLDAFPTILQALGFEGEIKKLGLGRNLFYNQKTLIEKYGLAELNLELKKRSRYYEKNLY
jgi:phosphoglycerol transferase